jgi:hypothetical protein
LGPENPPSIFSLFVGRIWKYGEACGKLTSSVIFKEGIAKTIGVNLAEEIEYGPATAASQAKN